VGQFCVEQAYQTMMDRHFAHPKLLKPPRNARSFHSKTLFPTAIAHWIEAQKF
jgi:hypothetical protein